MPKYRYIAISNDNQQLNGTIGAPDEASARRELNELGFSIISINEITEEQTLNQQSSMPIFEFAGLDKNGKRVIGTIVSEDRLSAYRRLISEYSFNVEYIIDNNLDEASKAIERQKGVYDLQQQIEEEEAKNKQRESEEEKDLREFEKEQAVLKSQIDFVLNKVREMLDEHEKNMKAETKIKIKNFVDKLIRIKTSTNLDYIRKTAEDLLTFLQNEELFQNEEAHLQARTRMLIEAKSLTMQLKKTKSKTSISFGESLRQWRKEHIINNPKPTLSEKAINILIGLLIGFDKENEKVETARKDIITLNNQIIQYLLLYLQAPNSEYKNQAKEGLSHLLQERKKRKQLLKEHQKELKRLRHEAGELTVMEKLRDDIFSFSGWLLVFYLIYYFISIYLTTKQFGLPSIPYVFYIFKSSFLKYFLTTLFLLHSAISIKVNFFKKSELATLIITPIFIFGSLLIIINF
jgi:hypothetical protein